MFELFLPKEEISAEEQKLRAKFAFVFRLLLACFLSCQTFDFLFSPIWMHGYVWSLNQKLEIEMSTKTAGAIVEHHLSKCGLAERICFSTLLVFLTWALLVVGGFRNRNRSVWHLLRLSMLVGCVTGLVRCLEMKQRLYPAIHEGFYVYFITFLTGVVLALQPGERFSKSVVRSSEGTATCSAKEGIENNEESKQITTNGVDKTFADSCKINGILSSSVAIISEGAEKCPKDK